MKRDRSGLGMVLTLFFIAVFMAACGGGSGGDSGIAYSGNMNAAVITNTSAEAIAVEAYESGEMGGDIAGTGSGPSPSVPSPAVPGPAALADIKSRVAGAVNKALSGGGVPRAMIRYTDTMMGECGGSAAIDINIDDATGDFSGKLTFANLCAYDGAAQEYTNGSVDFSGNVGMMSGMLNYFAMSFNALSVLSSDGAVNFVLDGSIGLTMTSYTSITMTMDMVMLDNLTGKTYWVNNYVVNVTDHGTYEEMTVTGRFYHHDYGYVDITTPTPVQAYPMNEHPYAGVLQFDGSGGRSARLTFISSTTYQVTADLNNDEAYDDFDSGVLPW